MKYNGFPSESFGISSRTEIYIIEPAVKANIAVLNTADMFNVNASSPASAVTKIITGSFIISTF